MNTQTQTTVTELLDPIWIEVVTEQLRDYPTSVALVIEPEILGRYHAQLGLPCEPYKFYRRLSDVNDYNAAYEGTTALWAAMVQAKNEEIDAGFLDRLAADREFNAIENDYVDDCLWSMRGY